MPFIRYVFKCCIILSLFDLNIIGICIGGIIFSVVMFYEGFTARSVCFKKALRRLTELGNEKLTSYADTLKLSRRKMSWKRSSLLSGKFTIKKNLLNLEPGIYTSLDCTYGHSTSSLEQIYSYKVFFDTRGF